MCARLRLLLLLSLVCLPVMGRAEPVSNAVRLAWLKLPGTPDPTSALISWTQELRQRTSIDVVPAPVAVRPEEPALFRYPLLYWSGDKAPPKLSDQAVLNLRQHLATGGTLIVDNAGRTEPSAAFEQGLRQELLRIFPQPLQPVPPTDVVFRTFYRLEQAVGRRADTHELDGIRIGSHYAVLYTRNDLGGALQRQNLGGYALAVVPGGETQREQALRLAVNLMMYALCLDYKDDHSHVMHLLRHRRGVRATPVGGK